MVVINFEQIKALAPHLIDDYADAFRSPGLAQTLATYQIDRTRLRVCHFLAQILTETGGLKVRRENLNYSPTRLMQVWPHRFPSLAVAQQYAHQEEKLGNFVYGGRLGNVQPGDGFLYRGRGLLQITGRGSYAKYGQRLSIPLEADPDLAFSAAHCLEIAAAEWAASGYHGKSCNELADADDIVGVTFAVNGGQTGIDDRKHWLERTKAIWQTAPAMPAGMLTSHAAANFDAAVFGGGGTSPVSGGFAGGSFAARAAQTANDQWDRFGRQTYNISGHATHVGHKEGEDPWYKYVGQYWKDGVDDDTLTGLNHNVPWSAAFISWVMKTSGAGERFKYSAQHSVYISRAIRDLRQGKEQAGYWCYRLTESKPGIGGLVCWARQDGIDYDHQNGGDYAGHCDVIVEVNPTQIAVVGGNVGDSVTKRPLALGASGFVESTTQGGELLFGIMKCRL